MSNIDKQAVQAVSDLKAGYTLGNADVAILNELARIALASLEAKAVAYIIQDSDARSRGEKGILRYFANISDEDINEYEITVTPLYAAPPATVSVPDFGALTKCIVQRLVDYGAADDDAIASAEEFVYNACRAAMLQGADGNSPAQSDCCPEQNCITPAQDGNSPVIPDGLENCKHLLPIGELIQRLEEQTGEKWARVGTSDAIPEGYALVPKEPTHAMINAWLSEVANWRGHVAGYKAAIAAAPQQEAE